MRRDDPITPPLKNNPATHLAGPATGKVPLTGYLARVGLQWLSSFAVLVLVWELAVRLFAIQPFTLPAPSRIAMRALADADLLAHHAQVTFIEIVLGLLIGSVLGIVTSLFMATTRLAEKLIWPILVATQALPVFAIAPLLVQWFGFGLASKIIMASLIIFFPVASATHDGLSRADPGLLDLGRLWGATKMQMLWRVRLPSALPSMASGLRIAAVAAPIGAVVGEWVGASAGLGYLMLHANARLQTDLVFAALIILAFVAIFIRAITVSATRWLLPWAGERDLHTA